MNKNELYDIDFEDLENQSSIRVLADKNRLFAAWLKKDEMYLEIHFDKKENTFIRLEGSLGQKLQKTDFSTEDKLERVLESLNNGLWNYFHPNENNKKRII